MLPDRRLHVPRFTRDTWRLPETCSCASPRTAAEAGHDPAFPLRASTSTRASVPCPVRVVEDHWFSQANFIAPCATPAVPANSGVAQPEERHADTRGPLPAPPHTHHHNRATPAMPRAARQHAAVLPIRGALGLELPGSPHVPGRRAHRPTLRARRRITRTRWRSKRRESGTRHRRHESRLLELAELAEAVLRKVFADLLSPIAIGGRHVRKRGSFLRMCTWKLRLRCCCKEF